MKEFIEKLNDRIEEKVKVTSLEIIVTGTNDKPYFEIKYKEIGKEYYNIGYSSYYLNKVFAWKEKYFEIVNQLEEEYKEECEYKEMIAPSGDVYFLTDCGNRHNGYLDGNRPYCGFCGKKIKAVE